MNSLLPYTVKESIIAHSKSILLLPKLSQVSSTSGEDGAEDEGEENPGSGMKQTTQQQ